VNGVSDKLGEVLGFYGASRNGPSTSYDILANALSQGSSTEG
jgi:hypothetical protein